MPWRYQGRIDTFGMGRGRDLIVARVAYILHSEDYFLIFIAAFRSRLLTKEK